MYTSMTHPVSSIGMGAQSHPIGGCGHGPTVCQSLGRRFERVRPRHGPMGGMFFKFDR